MCFSYRIIEINCRACFLSSRKGNSNRPREIPLKRLNQRKHNWRKNLQHFRRSVHDLYLYNVVYLGPSFCIIKLMGKKPRGFHGLIAESCTDPPKLLKSDRRDSSTNLIRHRTWEDKCFLPEFPITSYYITWDAVLLFNPIWDRP